MSVKIEKFKAEIQENLRDLEVVEGAIAPWKKRKKEIENNIQDLEIKLAKAEIAELGEWRPPAVDEYWKYAISIPKSMRDTVHIGNDIAKEFSKNAFLKAGFSLDGANERSHQWNFVLRGLDSKTADENTLSHNLTIALKAFADLYNDNGPQGEKGTKIFNIGSIETTGGYFFDHDFMMTLYTKDRVGVFKGQRFSGDDYIDQIVEGVMSKRAEMLGIPRENKIDEAPSSAPRM